VGTMLMLSFSAIRSSVHPHACGDDELIARHHPGETGSPPRVWGRYPGRSPGGREARFTPTRVGTMCSPSGSSMPNPVHPHACGDDPSPRDCTLTLYGSPPRVWGRWSPFDKEVEK